MIRVNRSQHKGVATELTRSGKAREVPLTADIAKVLAEHRRWMIEAQHPGLAVRLDLSDVGQAAGKSEDEAGELHMGNPFGKALDEASLKVGITRITPHGLRHTRNDLLRRFASREVVMAVMAITGHSTPAMHSHYSHVDQGEKAEAVGKVIELVTKTPIPPRDDRKRGLERGLTGLPVEAASATG